MFYDYRVEGNGHMGYTGAIEDKLREVVPQPLSEWREVYESFSPVDLADGNRIPRVAPERGGRRAAVLIPVLVESDGARLVYTVRKGHLQDHAGQISFPGGAADPGDGSLQQTALREAREEIDLPPDMVEVLGKLEEMYIPPSNFLVSPYVGLLPEEAELTLAPDEVEEIFTVGLDELLLPETYQKVIWRRDGRDYEVPVFAVGNGGSGTGSSGRREIWGATAAMTAVLLYRLGWRPDG